MRAASTSASGAGFRFPVLLGLFECDGDVLGPSHTPEQGKRHVPSYPDGDVLYCLDPVVPSGNGHKIVQLHRKRVLAGRVRGGFDDCGVSVLVDADDREHRDASGPNSHWSPCCTKFSSDEMPMTVYLLSCSPTNFRLSHSPTSR